MNRSVKSCSAHARPTTQICLLGLFMKDNKTIRAEVVEIQGNGKHIYLRKMVRECEQEKSSAENRDEANSRSQLLLKPQKGQAGTVKEIHVLLLLIISWLSPATSSHYPSCASALMTGMNHETSPVRNPSLFLILGLFFSGRSVYWTCSLSIWMCSRGGKKEELGAHGQG